MGSIDSKHRFWIVWCPERGLPKCKHETYDEAVNEAIRIAGIENKSIYVCECKGVAFRQFPPVTYEKISESA